VPSVRFGVYTFTERPDGIKDPIQGRVLVKEDTVVVELDARSCRYFARSDPTRAFVYDCGDVQLAFGRREPVATATYSTVKTVADRQATCVRYATDKNGNQVCAQQGSETVERRVPISGKLRLAYVANP
jgi:hypothetical protein